MGQALSSTPPQSQHIEFVGPAIAGANADGINAEATAEDDYVIIFSAVGAGTTIVESVVHVVPSGMDGSDLEVPAVETLLGPMGSFEGGPECSPEPGTPADEDTSEPYSDEDVDDSMESILIRAESYDATHFREKRTAKPLAHTKAISEQAKPKPAKYGRKKKKRAG